MDHLRYSGLSFETQRTAFLDIVSADPLIDETLSRVRALGLPDWLVVSGALYNSVWNHLTAKPSGYGIRDVDLFYFDESDLSYEAEDTVIRRAAKQFEGLTLSVEVRNQARVHLWFEARFGGSYPRLSSSAEALSYFASKTIRSALDSAPMGNSRSWRRSGSTTSSRFALPRTVHWIISRRTR